MAGFWLGAPYDTTSSEDQFLYSEIGTISFGCSLWGTVYMEGQSWLNIWGGELVAVGQGVVVSLLADVHINNEGTISATATGIWCEWRAKVDIDNSGEIFGQPSAISLNLAQGRSTISNTSEGSIRGHTGISVDFSETGAVFELDNHGFIRGERWAISSVVKTEIYNYGRIYSEEFAIVLGEFSDIVSNVASINGIIDLGGGHNRFFGDEGLQLLVRSGSGRDTITGGENGETFRSGSGNDVIFGGDGNDHILAENDDDVLHGFADDDDMLGGNGQDRLFGGAGKDMLNGGLHADRMMGGAGSDQFVFLRGNGRDTIADFQISGTAQDKIILRTTAIITGYADLLANHARQSGTDVVIRITDTDLLRLEDVRLASLTASDFLIS